ncbi:MAG: hypothetical protein HQ527_01580 [Cyanobacteria bacterium]|nr:hypothetical protein [Cyanobacteria bacterium bin.51]
MRPEQVLLSLADQVEQAHRGLGLILLVGLSISLSQVFALLANRLTPRQIAVQLVLTALLLALALLIVCLLDLLLLAAFGSRPVPPSTFVNSLVPALWPGLFYVLAAAPFIGNLIAVAVWALIQLNVILLLHDLFAVPYQEALLLATPGYVLGLVVVAILFRQSWNAGYRRLIADLDG